MIEQIQKIDWTNNELDLFRSKIMKRVYFTWFVRKVLVPAFVALPFASVLLIREFSKIEIFKIFETALSKASQFNIGGLFNYAIATIRYTELDSFLILVSSLLLAIFFARRLLRDVYQLWFGGPFFERYGIKERRL